MSASGQEYELADHVILLPGGIVAFQAKARDAGADSSDEAVVRWFKREVLKAACKQLADTKRFFETSRISRFPTKEDMYTTSLDLMRQ